MGREGRQGIGEGWGREGGLRVGQEWGSGRGRVREGVGHGCGGWGRGRGWVGPDSLEFLSRHVSTFIYTRAMTSFLV